MSRRSSSWRALPSVVVPSPQRRLTHRESVARRDLLEVLTADWTSDTLQAVAVQAILAAQAAHQAEQLEEAERLAEGLPAWAGKLVKLAKRER